MLRFQTAIASVLGALLVLPAVFGQGELATLEDALAGTARALEVLQGIQKRLSDDPAGAVGLLLSATEPPLQGSPATPASPAFPSFEGDERALDERLETLRSAVNLLQMELDALESPTAAALGAREPALSPRSMVPASPAGVTTGLDDALRALLAQDPAARATFRESAPAAAGPARAGRPAAGAAEAYSADPLRHAITCYRAGRFEEALELLAPLENATALHWRARTLERLERLDEAIDALERALARGGEGFEERRAQTDLEFLRWKRDFVATLGKKPAGPSVRPSVPEDRP